MISEKDAAEYNALRAALGELCKKYSMRKQELRLLLEETAKRRREACMLLLKANRMTRHLTGRQRQTSGLSYSLCEIEARISRSVPAIFEGPENAGNSLGEVRFPFPAELHPGLSGELSKNCSGAGELKRQGLSIIAMIDLAKKNLLQLDLLELRCRELLLSINKALLAFRHEYRAIRRKIYPFGIFSMCRRSLSCFLGSSYFSHRDMGGIAELGSLTGSILKIADSMAA